MKPSAGELASAACTTLLASLQAAGASDAVLSPGSRNLPLMLAAEATEGLRLHDIVDERAAGFFALGLARAGRRPLLICSSGSAAAHYLPALLEAHHSGLPVIVLSADRPPEAQGRQAHQTTNQLALFAAYTRLSLSLGLPDGSAEEQAGLAALGSRVLAHACGIHPGPVHLNVPFRKPLEPATAAATNTTGSAHSFSRFFSASLAPSTEGLDALAARLEAIPQLLFVAGPGAARSPDEADALYALAERCGAALLAEAGSGLRFEGRPRAPRLDYLGGLLRREDLLTLPAFAQATRPRLILRLGAQPTAFAFDHFVARLGAELWVAEATEPSDGASQASGLLQCGGQALADGLLSRLPATLPQGSARDATRQVLQALDQTLRTFLEARASAEDAAAASAPGTPTLDEQQVLRALLLASPQGSHLMLGNSLPIRVVDLALPGEAAALQVHTQRGLAGIDGLLAGAAGLSQGLQGAPLTLVLGDLSLAHDLGSLGLLGRSSGPLRALVLNNQGGRIFDELPAGRRQDLREQISQHLVHAGEEADPARGAFEHAAQQAKLSYACVSTPAELRKVLDASPLSRSAPAQAAAQRPAGLLIEARLRPEGARQLFADLDTLALS